MYCSCFSQQQQQQQQLQNAQCVPIGAWRQARCCKVWRHVVVATAAAVAAVAVAACCHHGCLTAAVISDAGTSSPSILSRLLNELGILYPWQQLQAAWLCICIPRHTRVLCLLLQAFIDIYPFNCIRTSTTCTCNFAAQINSTRFYSLCYSLALLSIAAGNIYEWTAASEGNIRQVWRR